MGTTGWVISPPAEGKSKARPYKLTMIFLPPNPQGRSQRPSCCETSAGGSQEITGTQTGANLTCDPCERVIPSLKVIISHRLRTTSLGAQ